MSAPDEFVTEDAPPLELDDADFCRLGSDVPAEKSAYTPITRMTVPAKTRVVRALDVPIGSIHRCRIEIWLVQHIVLPELIAFEILLAVEGGHYHR
jgi:hypothetical protein